MGAVRVLAAWGENSRQEGIVLFLYQKKWKGLLIFILSCSLLAGCRDTEDHSYKTANFVEDGKGASAGSGMDGKAEPGKEEGAGDADGSSVQRTPDTDKVPEATKKPKVYVEKSRFRAGKRIYYDNVRIITARGLCEYNQIKSKEYTDKPQKGNRFLVMFLDVENNGSEDLYFHPDYLSAKADGKDVKTTFLYHDPEGYKTMFRHIAAGDHEEGFIVWEVPKGWKKMTVTFKEFELLGGKRLKLTATRKDLKTPGIPLKSTSD